MALTTVAGYKARAGLSVATYDTEIGVVLTEVEKRVALYCDRTLEDSGTSITEYYNGTGDKILYLTAFPLVTITSVSYITGVTSGISTFTDYPTNTYYGDTNTGSLIFFSSLGYAFGDDNTRGWPVGEKNLKVVYQGGYTSANVPSDLSGAIYDLMGMILQGRDGTRQDVTNEQVVALLDDRIPHYRRMTL